MLLVVALSLGVALGPQLAGASTPPRLTIGVASMHVQRGSKASVTLCWTNVPAGWTAQLLLQSPPNGLTRAVYSTRVTSAQRCVNLKYVMATAGTYRINGKLLSGVSVIRLTGTIDIYVSAP